MIEAIIVAVSLMGQVYYEVPTVYVCPSTTVIGPPIYVDYCLGGMVQYSKYWTVMPYRDGSHRRVPIINGYAPRVTYQYCGDGSEHYLYDYRDRIRYADVMAEARDQKRPRVLPRPAPPSRPTLAPIRPLAPRPRAPEPLKPLRLVPVPTVDSLLRDPPTIPEPRVRISPSYRPNE
jgi:hypothetical protein